MHAIRHTFAVAALAAAVFAAPLMAHAAWDHERFGPHRVGKSPEARPMQTVDDSSRSLAPKPGTAFSREFVPSTEAPAVVRERTPGMYGNWKEPAFERRTVPPAGGTFAAPTD